MQRNLHFVLQVNVGPWHQSQQPRQVVWDLITQGNIGQQIINRWRHGRCRGGQEHLHPHAFFTHPACSVDLRFMDHVGRLHT